jgi:ParB-like chromosome segregation protein Spo0J
MMDIGHQVLFQLCGTREHEGKRIREWRAQSGPLASEFLGGRYSLGADYREPIEIPPLWSAEKFEDATERELHPFRLPFHPLANNFPMMDPSSPEFRGLVASIKQVGLTEPITMHEGKILDGRNRLRACQEAGVAPRFEDFDEAKDGPPLAFVLAKNLYRRHLTEGQKAVKALETVTTKHGGDRTSEIKCANEHLLGDQESKRPNGLLKSEPVTIDKAAALWCVSPRAVRRAAFVRDHAATPKIIEAVNAGRMTLGRAAMLAKETDEEQRAAPDVKFGGSKPKPRPAARPVTVPSLKALSDEQLFAIIIRELTRINRAAAREGKQVIVRDLATR